MIENFDVIAADEAENAFSVRLIENLRAGAAPASYLAIWVMDPARNDPKGRAVLKAVARERDLEIEVMGSSDKNW